MCMCVWLGGGGATLPKELVYSFNVVFGRQIFTEEGRNLGQGGL